MRVSSGLPLLLLIGCSPVDVDAIRWRCDTESDCGAGFTCRDDHCEPASRGVAAETITIGLIAPLGDAESAGAALRSGIEIAFNAINAAGGVHGRTLALDARDDGDDAAQARAHAEDFADAQSALMVVGGLGEHLAAEIAAVLVDAGVVHLSVGRSAAVHPAEAQRQLFAFGPDYPAEAAALVAHLTGRDQPIAPQNIALFTQAGPGGVDPHGQALAAALRAVIDPEPPIFSHTRGSADVDTALRALLDWLTTERETPEFTPVIVVGGQADANTALVVDLLEAFFGLRRGEVPRSDFGLGRRAAERLAQIGDPIFAVPSGPGAHLLVERLATHPPIRAARGADRIACETLLLAHPLPDPRTASAAEALASAADPPSALLFEGWVIGQAVIAALDAAGDEVSADTIVDHLEAVMLDVGVPFDFGADHVGIDAVLLSETRADCSLRAIE